MELVQICYQIILKGVNKMNKIKATKYQTVLNILSLTKSDFIFNYSFGIPFLQKFKVIIMVMNN